MQTPIFMPVGDHRQHKAMTAPELECRSADHPGQHPSPVAKARTDVIISTHGDLHRFATRKRPILTDSGGFQAFSLRGHDRPGKSGEGDGDSSAARAPPKAAWS